jgi:hypothetical protein
LLPRSIAATRRVIESKPPAIRPSLSLICLSFPEASFRCLFLNAGFRRDLAERPFQAPESAPNVGQDLRLKENSAFGGPGRPRLEPRPGQEKDPAFSSGADGDGWRTGFEKRKFSHRLTRADCDGDLLLRAGSADRTAIFPLTTNTAPGLPAE